MVILSVDYGDARTGLAVCDKKEILASPLGVISESYQPKVVNTIVEKAEEVKAEMIVIGLPRNMDGSYGYRCDECKSLGAAVSEACSIPVEFQDERLTTVIAHGFLSDNNVSGKKRKANVDAVSASVILQSFIDKRKNNG
jgi:putative Holliday junction resolvase